ncbi:6-pyruvoyl tetrahydrobiopterin synthase [Taenia solium]|eukprot:TsM_000414800 transcript=TsM_000414800 gene=TsM_000414800
MNPWVYVTRVATFSAAHRLYNTGLNEEENIRIFGKCAGVNGHGHNFKMEVTVFGEVDPVTGMVLNSTKLKHIIQANVLNLVDHKNLDLDVKYFRETNLVSTSENIVVFIWRCLRSSIDSKMGLEVRLYETENNIFYYRGD